MFLSNCTVTFGIWGDRESIGNGCGLQMDGFSAHFEPNGFIFNDFHDFGHFGFDFRGADPVRMCYVGVLPEDPRTPVFGSKAQ